ncbi:hypothetical protein ACTTAM_14040 [Rhodobacter capsulatus]|uniref:hypothetical protein n=1 Tax=Rhodobacter capsulatus TaxID=1061 RepID=UPI00402790D1
MFTNLSAVQINRLAQRLSDAPLGRSASVAAAAERFERLLAAKIGTDRAPKAIKSILTAPGLETAAGRLAAEIDAFEQETAAEPAPPLPPQNKPSNRRRLPRLNPPPRPAPRVVAGMPTSRPKPGRGNSPRRPISPPRPTPVSGRNSPRWWNWPEKADATGLRAVQINPVSSSPKALARYRDLAVLAIEAREGRA